MSDEPIDNELTQLNELSGEIIAPTLQLDPDEYREDWAEYEIPDEQFNEMLGVLWEMAQTFVLMGHNADITQILFANIIENSGKDSEKLLEREHTKNFKNCADHCIEKESGDE